MRRTMFGDAGAAEKAGEIKSKIKIKSKGSGRRRGRDLR
jgi:hypothetical protein